MINRFISQISKSLKNTPKQVNNPLIKKSLSLPKLTQIKVNIKNDKDLQNKNLAKKKYEYRTYNHIEEIQSNFNKKKAINEEKKQEIIRFISPKSQKNQTQQKLGRYISLEKISHQGRFVNKNQYSIDSQGQQNEIKQNLTERVNYKYNYEKQHIQNIKRVQSKAYQLKNQKDLFKKRMSQILEVKLLTSKQQKILSENSLKNSKIQMQKQKEYNSLNTKFTSVHKNQALINLKAEKDNKITKQKLIGEEAINKFYQKYKNIQKVRELQELNNQINPLTLILTVLQSYNIPPKKMQFIKKSGEQSILNLSHLSLGSTVSLNAISDILDKLEGFQSINLSYNNIVLDLVDVIIPQLTTAIQINLSHNRIGKRGADLLALMCKGEFLKCSQRDKFQSQQNVCLLQQLNLQQNCLAGYSLHNLLDTFIDFQQIRILDLSKNFLSNQFALKLKEYLTVDHCLDQLYLRWNDITSKGAKYIFEGLSYNKNLKVFDFSWNHISFESIPAICSFFQKNKTLLHLDLSFCDILQKDTLQLANSLKNNHTIYGIHYDGNQGKIDSMGYLIKDNKQKNDSNLSLLRRGLLQKINGVSSKNKFYQKYSAFKCQKTCWICDCWQQKHFQIKKQQNDQACFIHFDFQEFKGINMASFQSHFVLTKMVPQKPCLFFITKVNNKKQFTHGAVTLQNIDMQIRRKTFNQLKSIPRFFIAHKQFKNVNLRQLNVIQIQFSSQIFDQDYSTNISSIPRSQGLKPNSKLFQIDQPPFIPKKKLKVKKQRNKQKDKKARQLVHIQKIFTGQDSEGANQLFKKCVEFDFKHSKVYKLLTDQSLLFKLKNILSENYSMFKNVFYYLCNNNPSIAGIFNISQTRFEQFIQQQHYQTTYYTKAKIRLKLISTLSINDQISCQIQNKKQHKLLSRPQFFQFLLRIAIDKYCQKRKITNQQGQLVQTKPLSIEDAFKKMITKLKNFEQKIISPNIWRQQFLYSYDISLVIKSYEHFIQNIYRQYAGSQQKNLNTKNDKMMLLNQFKDMFLQAKIRKTKEALKDAEICFIQSKTLQVQDGNQQYGLSYIEFLEAFVRMAHGLNLKPINTQNEKIWQKIQQMQNHKQIKQSQQIYFEIPLFLKVQALIKEMYISKKEHRTKRMDKIFQRGLFAEQIQMLLQILKNRVAIVHQKYRPLMYQKTHKRIKVNTLGLLDEQNNANNEQTPQFKKINLQYLVSQLKLKYKRISEELDKNYSQYDQMSVQEGDQKVTLQDIPQN